MSPEVPSPEREYTSPAQRIAVEQAKTNIDRMKSIQDNYKPVEEEGSRAIAGANRFDKDFKAAQETAGGVNVEAAQPEGKLHYLPGHEPAKAAEQGAEPITNPEQIQGVAMSMQPQMNEALRKENIAKGLRDKIELERADTLSVVQAESLEERKASQLENRAVELRQQAIDKAANVADAPKPQSGEAPKAA